MLKSIVLASQAVIVLALASPAQAQLRTAAGTWVGSPVEEHIRLLQLTGVMPMSSLMIRPTKVPLSWQPPDSAPWRAPWSQIYNDTVVPSDTGSHDLRVFAPVVRSTYNSAIPYGLNDGAMWAGRGASVLVTAGGSARWRNVTVQLAPEFTWSENRAFELGFRQFAPANASLYADPWLSSRIDRPQRFGDKPVRALGWGQSAVTVKARNTKAGFSSENMWWGPGIDNSLLMTNNAAGFPHVFVGTDRAANVWLGNLEILFTVGWLKQSSFWRVAPDTFPDDRWLNSVGIVFEPRGAKGLYLGVGRTFVAYQSHTPISLKELATIFQTLRKQSLATPSNPHAFDARDQMMSLWLRWLFPEAGFEVYGEFGKGDHNWNGRDLTLEPDHASASVIGMQKTFRMLDGFLATRFELTNLASPRTASLRGAGFWYAHTRIQQGYTQKGQVMGAGIGTGSDQQVFAADWYTKGKRVGFFLKRHRNDSDSFYRAYQDPQGGQIFLHDVFLTAGIRSALYVGPALIDLSYMRQRQLNRYTLHRNDVTNHRLILTAQILPD